MVYEARMASLLALAERTQDILWQDEVTEPVRSRLQDITTKAMIEWKMYFDLLHEGVYL